ncbi:siderophore-iron reductase FhuF [Methylopila sp. 73B]|uniref:siderophore-iron reductase FhuF n=1 Tax=Methylopila sp. 73B TaxID=1120792 RepID=UPI0004645570|nr:siderophore-iron reductase FhuF [Methylopila sp. 73B]
MIEALRPIFSGPWEPFLALTVLPDDPRPSVPMREAVSREGLSAALAIAARTYGDEDLRGLVSLWSMQHAYVAMTGAVVASLALEIDLPVSIEETRLVMEHGLPAAIVVPHQGKGRSYDCAFQRFDQLIEGHVAPVVSALSAFVKISPKVLWNNAANFFEYVLQEMEKRPDQFPEAAARGRPLMAEPLRPDGTRNRFFAPVRYVDVGDPIDRWRNVCCLRHLLPEFEGYCANCPHRLKELQGAPSCATAAEL